jgi:hypothetical protein
MPEEIETINFRASQFGMLHAVQVAIRALVASHPRPEALLAEFAKEHHESISILLASPYPDTAIDGYKDFLRGCAPDPDAWLEA